MRRTDLYTLTQVGDRNVRDSELVFWKVGTVTWLLGECWMSIRIDLRPNMQCKDWPATVTFRSRRCNLRKISSITGSSQEHIIHLRKLARKRMLVKPGHVKKTAKNSSFKQVNTGFIVLEHPLTVWFDSIKRQLVPQLGCHRLHFAGKTQSLLWCWNVSLWVGHFRRSRLSLSPGKKTSVKTEQQNR